MKLIEVYCGSKLCGWRSDDTVGLYWYKSEYTASDKSPEMPTTIDAYTIGYAGIVRPEKRSFNIDSLTLIAAGLFGEARPCSFMSDTKWTGACYKYGIYTVKGELNRDEYVIIRNDGGGMYAYWDAGHTDWAELCRLLPPERLWDLCQVICHTYHHGRNYERARVYRVHAAGRLQRKKVRGQDAYRVTELAA